MCTPIYKYQSVKFCIVLFLLTSDGKFTNLKVLLSFSNSITRNSYSLIKTSFNQNCKKMKRFTLAFGTNMHFSNLFYSILDLFVLINTLSNRTSVNSNVEL